MVQSAAGGIGIGGQPAGATKLEVAGNAHVTGNVIATGLINAPGIFLQSGTVTASGNITAQGDLIASGNVTAPQYNIGSERVLAVTGAGNTLAGIGAGKFNSGSENAFFGTSSGINNAGSNNAAFGAYAGIYNSTGSNNAYFGNVAGEFNTTGSGNVMVGAEAGLFGNGDENTFVGRGAGKDFTGGGNVSLFGAETKASPGIHNATAIGFRATATNSDTLILGAADGYNGGTSVKVGIGTPQPSTRLEVAGGDLYVSSGNRSLILRTTGGFNCAKLAVNDQGQISATIITCPGSTGF